jgi:hypothetical protein
VSVLLRLHASLPRQIRHGATDARRNYLESGLHGKRIMKFKFKELYIGATDARGDDLESGLHGKRIMKFKFKELYIGATDARGDDLESGLHGEEKFRVNSIDA